MKKNIASIANETMNATVFAPRNERERKNSNCTIGALPWSSTSTKATRPTTAVASSATISVDPQPQLLPSTSASTSAERPTDSAPIPAKSTCRPTVLSNDSRTAKSVTTTAPIATGRLRKKIARHDTYSVSAPPTAGPIASANADTPAHVPIARPRSCGGKVFEMIERVPGIMNAAPMPWIARPATSRVWLGARPISALEAANTITPPTNMRRLPKMSPSRPPVTSSTAKLSVYALTVHSRLERLAPRSFWIDGSATFTTVLSSMIMNSAKHMAASVHHLRLPSFRRMRSGTGGVLSGHAGDDGGEGGGEPAALLVREGAHELGDAGEAQLHQVIDQLMRLAGRTHGLQAAILRVLLARDETPVHERVDRAAHGGEGEADRVGQCLERRVVHLAGEQVEDADLGDRQVELTDGGVEVTSSGVEDELGEGAQIAHEIRVGSCLHACNGCRRCQDRLCACSHSVLRATYAQQSPWKPPLHSESRMCARSATAWSSTASSSTTTRRSGSSASARRRAPTPSG